MSYKQNIEVEFWGMVIAGVIIICAVGAGIAVLNCIVGQFL